LLLKKEVDVVDEGEEEGWKLTSKKKSEGGRKLTGQKGKGFTCLRDWGGSKRFSRASEWKKGWTLIQKLSRL
jgi:hypothetical protein